MRSGCRESRRVRLPRQRGTLSLHHQCELTSRRGHAHRLRTHHGANTAEAGSPSPPPPPPSSRGDPRTRRLPHGPLPPQGVSPGTPRGGTEGGRGHPLCDTTVLSLGLHVGCPVPERRGRGPCGPTMHPGTGAKPAAHALPGGHGYALAFRWNSGHLGPCTPKSGLSSCRVCALTLGEPLTSVPLLARGAPSSESRLCHPQP